MEDSRADDGGRGERGEREEMRTRRKEEQRTKSWVETESGEENCRQGC